MRFYLLLAAAAAFIAIGHAARADSLDDIRHRGHLVCEVSIDTDDYSGFDAHGDLSRFETAYCRALSATILGDPKRASVVSEGDEITGLRKVRDGHADLMIGSTPDPALGLTLRLAFAPPILIDGQGFLVSPGLAIHDLAGLKDTRICFIGYAPAAATLRERLDELGIDFSAFEQSERGEMEGALATNHCNVVTSDVTQLAAMRLSLPALRNYTLLEQTITTDPLSPAIRAADSQLIAVVTALDGGLLNAEEHGVTRANAADLARTSKDPMVKRLLGAQGWIGPSLGLDDRWLLRAIEAEGNHAEIFGRDAGAGSPFRLPVGANAPVSAGGALIGITNEVAR